MAENGAGDARVVVVTGASSGVGRAIAREFGRTGARVGLLARNREPLDHAAQEIAAEGGEGLVLPVDVADPGQVDSAAAAVIAKWGRIDVWVNVAMVSVFAPAWEVRPEEFRRVTEVNYLGFVHGTLAALRTMRPRDRGVILQVGSALQYRSIPLQSAYCASKAAIRGFTDSLRSELVHEKSHVKLCVLVLPGVNTPQFEVVRSRLPRRPQPVPPIYQPEIIARAAVYASEHPTRELWIGASVFKAVVGQRFIPGLLDRYLAKKAWDGQMTDEPALDRPDNVDSPIPGDRGAHGRFDPRSSSRSPLLMARTHRGTVAAVSAGVLAGVGAALALRRRMRASGEGARSAPAQDEAPVLH